MNKNTTIIILIIVVVAAGFLAISKKVKYRQAKDKAAQVQVAPVPANAFGVKIDQAKGYFVEEINDGVYWVTEGAYQMMFVVTGRGVVVVDAPPSIGENILKAIAEVTDEPITHVIYSHSHADHIAAASMYPPDAVYIAHAETAKALAKAGETYGVFVGGSTVPKPTITFNNTYTLIKGNHRLVLDYKGPNHNPGNLFIYLPNQKVLMLIDVIFPGWTPFKDLAITKDVNEFIKAHDDILAFDFDTLISGHLGRLGTREDVEIQKEYVLDIQANAIKALQAVDFNAVAEKVGFANPWLLFDTYLNKVSGTCTELTEAKWLDRLGGVDIFTESHCFQLLENLRVN